MKNEVTSRMMYIIETLIRKNQISINEICQSFGTSARKIRYDIVKINQIVEDFSDTVAIETDHKGMILVKNKNILVEFFEKHEKVLKFSKEQRTNLLSLIISFHIEKLNLNHLSKQLRVTRATIKNDLKSVEEELHQNNLKLQYSHSFNLVGKEEDIFEYRVKCLRKPEYSLFKENKEEIELLMLEYTLSTFATEHFKYIFPIINNFTKINNLYLNDRELYWLASVLLTMIWYIHNKIDIPKEKYFNVKVRDLKYDAFFDDLSKFTNSSMDPVNKEIIIKVISSLGCTEQKERINVNVIRYIVELIGNMEQKFCKYFKNDLHFLDALYKHLNSYYHKEVLGIELPFSEKYTCLLDNDIQKYIENFLLEHKNIIEIADESEIYLLKLHFANCMQRKNTNKMKKIILVSGTSQLHSNSLKKSLEEFFEVEVYAVLSRYNLPFFTHWEGVDLILFTETIPEYFTKQIPTLKINLILDRTDFNALYSVGVLPKKKDFDFMSLYKEMDFLCKEDQKRVFQCIQNFMKSNHLTTSKTDAYFTIAEEKISNAFETMLEYPHIRLNLKLGEKNKIVFQNVKNELFLEIEGMNIATLCSSLIKLYIEKDIIPMYDEKMLEILVNAEG